MGKVKEAMTWRNFGAYLLETGDLDPIYIGLVRLELPSKRLAKWLISYWCFYHAGLSCALSELSNIEFWRGVTEIAGRPASPRGTERRHFRGQKAVKAVEWIADACPEPEDAIWSLVDAGRPPTFRDISERIQTWPLFGPWIAFKAVDMLDRCAGVAVNVSDCALEMYKEPVAGANLIATLEKGFWSTEQVVNLLLTQFGDMLAPPRYERLVDILEVETILCKFKSHFTGHYPPGKDSREVIERLEGYGETAEKMLKFSPQPRILVS